MEQQSQAYKAKRKAHQLKRKLREHGVDLRHAICLEAVARCWGYGSWHDLLQGERVSVEMSDTDISLCLQTYLQRNSIKQPSQCAEAIMTVMNPAQTRCKSEVAC